MLKVMQTTQMSISKNLMNLRNLYNLVRNIDFKEIRAVFQNQLNKDINILIKTHWFIPADKSNSL